MVALFQKGKGSRASEGVPQIGMVITDGQAMDPFDMERSAKLLGKHGVSLMAIGIEITSKEDLFKITGTWQRRCPTPQQVLTVTSESLQTPSTVFTFCCLKIISKKGIN
jgi:hypothetical protein